MKLTKTVKDYIAAKVAAKYADYDKDAIEAHKKIADEVEAYCRDAIKKMNAEFEEKFQGVIKPGYKVFDFTTHSYRMPSYDLMTRMSNERKRITEEKTNEILVTMELGGTKEDLDRMLAEL